MFQRCLALFVIVFLTSGALADDLAAVFPSEGPAAAKRLDELRELIKAQSWDAFLEQIDALLEEGNDDLVPLDKNHSVQSRRLYHALIANLPPEQLAAYRKKVDSRAQRWLEEGEAKRDPKALRKIVDTAYCSTPGERALELLGDLAFERGRFDEAVGWWEQLLVNDQEKGPAPLRYPHPKTSAASVHARQFLARLYHGSIGDMKEELTRYSEQFPKAEGMLGGKKGLYKDLLRPLADRYAKSRAAPAAWTTFGGDTARGLVIPTGPRFLEDLGELCRTGPTWRYDLSSGKKLAPNEERINRRPGIFPPTMQARSMAFQPLIVAGKVLASDSRYLRAYDLRTGEVEEWYDAVKDGRIDRALMNQRLPAAPDLRFTLTVADDLVFARLGAQNMRDIRPDAVADRAASDTTESLLACIKLRPEKGEPRIAWQVRATDKEPAIFEGAPLVHDGLAYIAVTRVGGSGRTITAVRCYPVEATAPQAPRWSVDICEANELSLEVSRTRHHLLTLSGNTLFYCSQYGAIVALDAATGRRLWGVRYPHRPSRTVNAVTNKLDHSPSDQRDLTPCVAANGKLYVAPADSENLYCLDPATGAILWERESLGVVQLLGVGHGRLIFTTCPADRGEQIAGERPFGLRAVGAEDGDDAHGWLFPETGGLVSMGRGILIGDLVLWPTSASKAFADGRGMRVVAVRQSDGRQPADCPTLPRNVPVGNLAWADGCLAVADRDVLSIFVPDELRLDELRKEAENDAKAEGVTLSLARAELGAGHFAEAQKVLDRLSGERRADEIKSLRWRIHMAAARHEMEAVQFAAADDEWDRATGPDVPAALRLEAIRQAATAWRDSGETARGVALLRKALADPAMRDVALLDERDLPVKGVTWARDFLTKWRENGGPVVQADEKKAAAVKEERPGAQKQQPGGGPGWTRVAHVALADGERPLALDVGDPVSIIGLVFGVLRGRGPDAHSQFTCYTLSDGKARWHRELDFVPCWTAVHDDHLIVAGAQGLACLKLDDGSLVWHWTGSPDAANAEAYWSPLPISNDLASFQIVDGRLLFLEGNRRLWALSAATGDVIWSRWAPGGSIGLGRFSSSYAVTPEDLLIQTGGQRLVLDPRSGQEKGFRKAISTWPLWCDPLPTSANQVFHPEGARRVTAYDGQGSDRWTYDLPGNTRLTGTGPQMLLVSDRLLLLIATNLGYRLQCLKAATGKPCWTVPLLQGVRLDLHDWAVDSDAIYFVFGGMLQARALADGKLLWERPVGLADSAWTTRRVGDSLLAYPQAETKTQFRFRWLLGALQCTMEHPANPDGPAWSIECRDPKSGQLTQRLNFPLDQPRLRLDSLAFDQPKALPLGEIQASPDRTRPQLRANGDGAVTVGIAGNVWLLATK